MLFYKISVCTNNSVYPESWLSKYEATEYAKMLANKTKHDLYVDRYFGKLYALNSSDEKFVSHCARIIPHYIDGDGVYHRLSVWDFETGVIECFNTQNAKLI